jgi:hypothetical protein
MADWSIPPGWEHNPSRWAKRLPVLVLALAGFCIAGYLALYQLDVVPTVWEPFFGNGSKRILKESSIAHLLPIPDAALGALMYLAEAVADCIGGPVRWRTKPWAVFLFGLIACGLGITGVVLVICQPVLFGAFCTLCLASAACSLLLAAAALGEVWATWQHLQRQSHHGRSMWHVLWNGDQTPAPSPSHP